MKNFPSLYRPPSSYFSRVALLAACVSCFWANHSSKASQVTLTNLEGKKISADLKSFDGEKRKIQLEKDGKQYDYSLRDLQFSSKVAALRTPEMREVLDHKTQQQGPPVRLYALLTGSTVAVLLVLGLPTFMAAAFLITGQEGRGLHFKAWLKIVALAGVLVGIRIALLGGIQWTDVATDGLRVFRPEDGLALAFALAGSIWLVKRHYRETLKLASTTIAVHLVFFGLLGAGAGWLVWRWYGGDWQIPADELLTRQILQPLDLI